MHYIRRNSGIVLKDQQKVHVFRRTSGKFLKRRANLQVNPRQTWKIRKIAKFNCTFACDLLILAKIVPKTCIFVGPCLFMLLQSRETPGVRCSASHDGAQPIADSCH